MEKALVLLSGGQDSATCLYWAIQKFGHSSVEALTFYYGQRHTRELTCARRLSRWSGINHRLLKITTFSELGGNALTQKNIKVNKTAPQRGLPNTFVPGRNIILFSFAAAYAYSKKIRHLVGGMAQTDYSGYPDCRGKTIRSLEKTLRLGLDYPLSLHTPLMYKSKAQTIKMAQKLGAYPALALTHTCYNNQFPPCGYCPACRLRAKGFAEAKIVDPLLLQKS